MIHRNKVLCWNALGQFWNWTTRMWDANPVPMDTTVFIMELPMIRNSGKKFDSCFVEVEDTALYNKVVSKCRTGAMGWSVV